MKKIKNKKTAELRNVFGLCLLGLFCFVIFKNWNEMKGGIALLASIPVWWISLSALFYSLTTVCGALAYKSLALKKVSWRELLTVEWASSGINRLLPVGSGSIGIHGLFLLKRKHSVAEAVTVVGLNNLLGVTTHLLMLGIVFMLVPSQNILSKVRLSNNLPYFALVGLIILASLLFMPKIRKNVRRFLDELAISLSKYKNRPVAVFTATLAALGVTFINTVILYMAMKAIGIDLSLVAAFVIFSTGVVFGALFPTPGGLGSVEAGLATSLIAFNVDTTYAIAAALLFRVINFWMPLLVGNIVFLTVRHRDYF